MGKPWESLDLLSILKCLVLGIDHIDAQQGASHGFTCLLQAGKGLHQY